MDWVRDVLKSLLNTIIFCAIRYVNQVVVRVLWV